MVSYDIHRGTQNEVAEKICLYYNDEKFNIVNVVYSVFYDDVFQTDPIHHAIVYYKNVK